MTIHYHAGHNMPGYLPESDPTTFDTFEDAAEYMRWEIVHYVDSIPRVSARKWARDYAPAYDQLATETGPDWGDTIDNYAYWIVSCADDCEVDTDE